MAAPVGFVLVGWPTCELTFLGCSSHQRTSTNYSRIEYNSMHRIMHIHMRAYASDSPVEGAGPGSLCTISNEPRR